MSDILKLIIWVDIPNYKGVYQINKFGQVRGLPRLSYNGKRLKGKIMKQHLSTDGYLRVVLSKNCKRKTIEVHRLMAYSFLNHKPDSHIRVVDHIDNDKLNNNIDNLQIVSQRVNCTKDRRGGSSKYLGVSLHKQTNKWRAIINIKGKSVSLGLFNCELKAAQAYQLKRQSL